MGLAHFGQLGCRECLRFRHRFRLGGDAHVVWRVLFLGAATKHSCAASTSTNERRRRRALTASRPPACVSALSDGLGAHPHAHGCVPRSTDLLRLRSLGSSAASDAGSAAASSAGGVGAPMPSPCAAGGVATCGGVWNDELRPAILILTPSGRPPPYHVVSGPAARRLGRCTLRRASSIPRSTTAGLLLLLTTPLLRAGDPAAGDGVPSGASAGDAVAAADLEAPVRGAVGAPKAVPAAGGVGVGASRAAGALAAVDGGSVVVSASGGARMAATLSADDARSAMPPVSGKGPASRDSSRTDSTVNAIVTVLTWARAGWCSEASPPPRATPSQREPWGHVGGRGGGGGKCGKRPARGHHPWWTE